MSDFRFDYCCDCNRYIGPDGDGICDECAQKAYDEAEAVPLSEERIQEIVDFATRDDAKEDR